MPPAAPQPFPDHRRELTRRESRLFAELKGRHGRKKSEFCVCEGVRACGELFASAAAERIELIAATRAVLEENPLPAALDEKVAVVEEPALRQLSGTVNSQGILALVRRPLPPPPGTPVGDPYILALDRLGDPGNFGTILRTARAAGLHEVWYTEGSVDPFSAKVIRSALAAQFAMTLRGFADLEALAEEAEKLGFGPLCLTDPHQGESCFLAPGLFDRTVIVIGSEAHGVGAAEGRRITIPMPGEFESLNAAQAATIVLFEAVRRAAAPGRAE